MVVYILADHDFINLNFCKVSNHDENKGTGSVLSSIFVSIFNQLHTVNFPSDLAWDIEKRFFCVNLKSLLVPSQDNIRPVGFAVNNQQLQRTLDAVSTILRI